ncbi:MAG: GAF domain-containing protein [Cytophagales bacterium]|nr:GAF domain-containing protein [Cytophagales bacterium]
MSARSSFVFYTILVLAMLVAIVVWLGGFPPYFLWLSVLMMTLALGWLLFLRFRFERALWAVLADGAKDYPRKDSKRLYRALAKQKQVLDYAIASLKKVCNGQKLEKQLDQSDSLRGELSRLIHHVDQLLKEKNQEEERRTWGMRGMADFSELLRNDERSLSDKADAIISKLVTYVQGSQGGLFIKRGQAGDERMELLACYAYDKKRYRQKEIAPREGLVGQCWLEAEPIIMTDIPDRYVEITSGLGQKTASFLAIYPLIYDDAVVGVVELAAFQPFESHVLDFIGKVCSNVAAFLQAKMIVEAQKRLLEESARMNMALQEQELRQNAEEMRATQEQLERKVTFQQECIQKLQDAQDNAVINAAGRNRMLAQKIAFYALLCLRDAGYASEQMLKAIDLHHQTLQAFKYGGALRDIGEDIIIQPVPRAMTLYLERIMELWMPFKAATERLAELSVATDQSLEQEELISQVVKLTEPLIARNNELVTAYTREYSHRRQNIFEELESSLKVA